MNKKVIFTVAGALVLFGGPLVAPQPGFAQAAAAPSCEQLAAESTALQGKLEAMTRDMMAAASGGIRAAQTAVTVSTIASNIPVLGGLIEQVSSAATAGAMQASQSKMTAMAERMAAEGPELANRLEELQTIRAERCGLQVEPSEGDE